MPHAHSLFLITARDLLRLNSHQRCHLLLVHTANAAKARSLSLFSARYLLHLNSHQRWQLLLVYAVNAAKARSLLSL
jgi:hypothetical protein